MRTCRHEKNRMMIGVLIKLCYTMESVRLFRQGAQIKRDTYGKQAMSGKRPDMRRLP